MAQKLMMISEAGIFAVKHAMQYNDGSRCCSKCEHYTSDDCSGSPFALQRHCDVNAFLIPVEPTGTCQFFSAKQPA